MPEPRIPKLTPEEANMAYTAAHAENVTLAFVLHYLHWAKARAQMLDTIVQTRQLTLIGEKGGSE